MATAAADQEQQDDAHLLRSYIGLSFSVFLALLPTNLRTKARDLTRAEEELSQMRSRRREDSKANARVAEIFASHRNAWRDEEKRLLRRIDAAGEEIARLRAAAEESRARAEELEREVAERDEMIEFMSRRIHEEGLGGCQSRDHYGGKKNQEWFHNEQEEEEVGTTRNVEEEGVEVIYEHKHHHSQSQSQHLVDNNGFDAEFMASASKFWAEKASLWQDVQHESLESMYSAKQFVARRESPWKVDGDSAGVSSKLKLLDSQISQQQPQPQQTPMGPPNQNQNQKPLIYAFVSRGTVILAEFTEFSGNFNSIAFQCLQKLPSTSNKFTYNCDAHTFNFLVDNGYTYCIVADESVGRQVPMAFLERVKDDFVSKYGDGKAATAPANSLNKEFGPKLKEHMQYCVDHPEEISKLAKVKAQVSEVKGVMMENIEKVLDRGEKIELLVDKTENLHHQAQDFRTSGTSIRRKMWLQNMKIKLIVLGILIALILIIVLSATRGFQK